jgi:transcriptional regulator with GAF, ATPase, and Fis domain
LRTLAEVERDYIRDVLRQTGGMIAGAGGAAEFLGLPPSTLRSRMKKLGIK